MKKLLPVLALIMTPTCGVMADEAVRPATVKLTPLTFSMACVGATGDESRQLLERAANAESSVGAKECVDKSAQVKDARIVTVVTGKARNIDIYEVVLKLDPGDAKKLAGMTLASGGPRRIVLSVKGYAIIVALLNAPIYGERFLISAATADDALRISNLFVE